jgi:TDG/mug DNA glycosylase family protein
MLRLERRRRHRQGRPLGRSREHRFPCRADRADPARVRGTPRGARARSGIASPTTPSSVPDVLGPGLTVVFCGINPGRFSDAANAHFANPRNDFWRLLHGAGFTPRLFDPTEQFDLLPLRIGVTNAAYRTTPGSGDLRARDFAGSAERLEELASALRPGVIAFVGKEAYRGPFRERAEHGPQERRLGPTSLFVLPSTSPANAAVPWEERLRWFHLLRALTDLSATGETEAKVIDDCGKEPHLGKKFSGAE